MGRTSAELIRAEPPRPGDDRARDATVLARVAALKTLSVAELKAEWHSLFGADAPNNSRPFLELRLGYRIQELAYGGPSRETVRMLDALADELHGKPGRKTMLRKSRGKGGGRPRSRSAAGSRARRRAR